MYKNKQWLNCVKTKLRNHKTSKFGTCAYILTIKRMALQQSNESIYQYYYWNIEHGIAAKCKCLVLL